MAIPKIIGAQRDFSAGELDLSMKRADENPMMKIGARQLSNFNILCSGAAANRPGRRALFLEAGRVEKVLMSPGNIFYLVFGVGYLRVYNAAGARVFNSTTLGGGSTAVPWTSTTIANVSFVVAPGANYAAYIAFADGAPNNPPQVLSWDGVSQTSTWTLATYAEAIAESDQKRTFFYRISPQNVTLQPSAASGNIDITFSSAVLVAGMVGTRMAYCGRQILITAVTLSDYSTPTSSPSQYGTATCEEVLPGSQICSTTDLNGVSTDPASAFSIGDAVVGSLSGAHGIVTAINSSAKTMQIQLYSGESGGAIPFIYGGTISTSDQIVGPGGSLVFNTPYSSAGPQAVALWDEELMNIFRGYPSAVFYDQSRLGFCNFPVLPSAIGWSAIGLPFDLFAVALGAIVTASSAILELVPGKSQALFVQPGMESSEFVFCDNAIYYIPITVQNPLKPGSVAFNLLNSDGCLPNVRPQPIQQSILYMKAGGARVGAVQAPGAYYRPYVVDDVSEFHSHLFLASPAIAIAAPSAPAQSEETYAYILLANGSIVMAKYNIRQGLIDIGPDNKPKMGWLPWNGAGNVTWISAQQSDLVFTSTYQPTGAAAVSVAEALDYTQNLDCAISVASPPAPFVTSGKGPLYFLAGGSVTLFDGARPMGTYQIDANGNIIAQFNGGENLSSATLVVGQPWTAILEPFIPDAPPGQSVHQRMFKRRVSRMAVYVSNSSGFDMARLFSGPITPTTAADSLALGTVMNRCRIPAWNIGDNVEVAPPLREQAYRWRPLGRSYDPRVAVIKQTPGPLTVHEIGLEASV